MPHRDNTGRRKNAWRGQVKFWGQRFRKRCPSKAAAKAWEIEFKRSLTAQRARGSVPPTVTISLIEWSTAYLDYALRYTQKVYSEKQMVMKTLLRTWGDIPVETITRGMALQLLQSVHGRQSGYATNKVRKNLGAAWNYGVQYMEGFPAPNHFLSIRPFPTIAHPRYVPPEKDFWAVYDMAQGQDELLLLAFVYTAARRGELYRLTWLDVDFEASRLRLFTRKRTDGSMEGDWIPMIPGLCKALAAHRPTAHQIWVFTQLEGRRKGHPYTDYRGFPQTLCHQAGVPPFGCHAIRHLTASMLAQLNVPMVVIKDILRHRKVSTTEGYVRGVEPVRPYLQLLEGRGQEQRSPRAVPHKKLG